ncbi:protein RodZ, contains Xre-like HTH and DUF4115 domains [Paucidesulfovibrio gracilis DSM 16080]|uniref:Protein RodZ, contains Xre-like HTH and DUF4115 domains n=1 Tax=Paucidesulfovibrio gracilis DSM 16080 TaxID=1121449 RepID=A0A1T4WVD0_9BACT|nr:helix-turn-helix domain-containing protein [Paucidesulfovibrio gracilis]SKA80808.1 protein RodZ, contains Xre-like HTH and DUF4115 domains [Paucidesulfovibrio gracilis DSM 16080]
MDLIQLGARMRQEREARKLSLADVTEATKISRRILVAFEDGDTDHFPHPVYAKGFLRNYARLLGMDPQECVRVLEREFHPDEDVETGTNVGISVKDLSDPCSKGGGSAPKWGAVAVVLVLLALLGGLVWFMMQEGEAARSAKAVAEPEVEQVLESEKPSAKPERASETGASASDSNPSDALPVAVQEPSIAASAGVSSSEAEQAASSREAKEDHLLEITAEEDVCWVGVFHPDGEEIGDTPWGDEFTVQPGQTVKYAFNGQRKFRFGRLERVQLVLDGKEHPVTGTGVVDVALP